MELWIRNQDKTLLAKVDRIVLEDFDNSKPKIYSNDDFLGEYETKERALEVLDEIQNILMPKLFLNASSIKPVGDNYTINNGVVIQEYNAEAKWEQPNIYVYEMPKD